MHEMSLCWKQCSIDETVPARVFCGFGHCTPVDVLLVTLNLQSQVVHVGPMFKHLS